mmetsp:Transcript_13159/g.22291  ORF Transcript_13159/g.22291 Transcript_13159/m.22291 type:complete len:123 (-) Transcript_13159:444-812(-)|eukprot:CAMPEP_0168627958 /NCGR_PEP_ID=MMETSP0449_2-20121227/11579_1 /TAXON_ID=1082188 /ORGANISM="Strombidium rassoulzadegani, Strain ras09" /LENGTH=122 /DNA_ID=CAMNT_0008670327 /DNA_START=348 /DNA_END=716 /DNA_ORIENTATION=+
MIKEAEKNGYDWIFINYRGMRLPLANQIPFTSNDTPTFSEAIDHIVSFVDQERKLFLVGTSLGGNVATNIVSLPKYGDTFNGAVAVHPALDLEKCMIQLETYNGGQYDRIFGKGLKLFYNDP